jgi:hypothetical protein
MVEQLLDLICDKGIYTEIAGVTSDGAEKILNKSRDGHGIYFQVSAFYTSTFSADMVKTILFHEKGITITLKH